MISTCVRLLVFGTAYIIFQIGFLNMMLLRRKSMRLFMTTVVLYFIKQLVMGYVLELYWLNEADRLAFQSAFNLFNTVYLYIVICYTFEGSVLKIGLMQLICEVNYLAVFLPILMLLDHLEGRETIGIVAAPFTFFDLLQIVYVYGIFRLEKWLLRSFTPRIRKWEPRCRKLLWCVLVFYFGMGIATSFQGLYQRSMFKSNAVVLALFVAAGCMAAVYLYSRYRRRTEQTSAFVRIQKNLMALHYRAIRQQIEKMESEQARIDRQMEEIVAMSGNVAGALTGGASMPGGARNGGLQERIQSYIASLQEKYEEIQAGIYCGDYLVDGVLYHMAKQCREREIPYEFSFQKYNRGVIPEEEVAELVYQILEFCLRESEETEGKKEGITLEAAAIKNQLFFTFTCPSEKNSKKLRRMLRKKLLPLIIPYHGEVKALDAERGILIQMERIHF